MYDNGRCPFFWVYSPTSHLPVYHLGMQIHPIMAPVPILDHFPPRALVCLGACDWIVQYMFILYIMGKAVQFVAVLAIEKQ